MCDFVPCDRIVQRAYCNAKVNIPGGVVFWVYVFLLVQLSVNLSNSKCPVGGCDLFQG